jgi:hypothetical protein
MTRGMGDDGQVYTMEGVIAGLILVLTLMYITSSITLVSPQTEKSLVMKQGIKAADILNVLSAKNCTLTNHNPLLDAIALWNGNVSTFENSVDNPVNASEFSIMSLNKTIGMILHDCDRHNNTLFNVYLIYNDSTGSFTNKPVILNGEPSDFDNAASASKIIVLHLSDQKSDYWKYFETSTPCEMPKVIEVRLVLWSV